MKSLAKTLAEINVAPFADAAPHLQDIGLSPIPCGTMDGQRPSIRGWNKLRFIPRTLESSIGSKLTGGKMFGPFPSSWLGLRPK